MSSERLDIHEFLQGCHHIRGFTNDCILHFSFWMHSEYTILHRIFKIFILEALQMRITPPYC
jgi:hypothetical protein